MSYTPDIKTIFGTDILGRYRVTTPTPLNDFDKDQIEKVQRAAGNIQLCISSGIEAIGEILSSAGLNIDEVPLTGTTIADIGDLISHLSKELVEVIDIQDTAESRLELAKVGGEK